VYLQLHLHTTFFVTLQLRMSQLTGVGDGVASFDLVKFLAKSFKIREKSLKTFTNSVKV